MTAKAYPRVGALAVLVDEARVLLARRINPPDAGLWGYPGGHVEPGETIRDAAARELAEETGILARPAEILTCLDAIGRDDAGELSFHYVLVAVRMTAPYGDLRPMDDVSEVAWIPAEVVLSGDLDMSRDVGSVLRRALRDRTALSRHGA